METLNAELMRTITELKALPKKDRKAIERQLSGLDKLAVKKVLKIKPVMPSKSEGEDTTENENGEEETIAQDFTKYSPWLKKILSEILEVGENLNSGQVTQAVSDVLPECIEYANSRIESFPVKNDIHDRATFKSMLLRLRG